MKITTIIFNLTFIRIPYYLLVCFFAGLIRAVGYCQNEKQIRLLPLKGVRIYGISTYY